MIYLLHVSLLKPDGCARIWLLTRRLPAALSHRPGLLRHRHDGWRWGNV